MRQYLMKLPAILAGLGAVGVIGGYVVSARLGCLSRASCVLRHLKRWMVKF